MSSSGFKSAKKDILEKREKEKERILKEQDPNLKYKLLKYNEILKRAEINNIKIIYKEPAMLSIYKEFKKNMKLVIESYKFWVIIVIAVILYIVLNREIIEKLLRDYTEVAKLLTAIISFGGALFTARSAIKNIKVKIGTEYSTHRQEWINSLRDDVIKYRNLALSMINPSPQTIYRKMCFDLDSIYNSILLKMNMTNDIDRRILYVLKNLHNCITISNPYNPTKYFLEENNDIYHSFMGGLSNLNDELDFLDKCFSIYLKAEWERLKDEIYKMDRGYNFEDKFISLFAKGSVLYQITSYDNDRFKTIFGIRLW